MADSLCAQLLVEQFAMLETMSPFDFMDFRSALKKASGSRAASSACSRRSSVSSRCVSLCLCLYLCLIIAFIANQTCSLKQSSVHSMQSSAAPKL